MYDLIIIGAGPAGLTAALYALRANKNVLIIDKNGYGGQIINSSMIENYPAIENISGYDFATNLYNQVKKNGGKFTVEKVIEVDEEKKVKTINNEYKAKKVIIATGSENRKLNLQNEDKLIGKGISYCATCDGNFYKNKIVAIVGGGNTALEDAIYLSDIVKKIYLIHRKDAFTGEQKYIDEVKNKKNIEIILNSNVTEINGIEKLEYIILNNEKKLFVDGLFIAIGQEPKNEIFKNIVDLDEYGYIKSIDGVHTKTNGIYVAGDTRVKSLRQLTTAVSDGSIAATFAIKEL